MSVGTDQEKETIRQVVRGERPLTDLGAVGITMRFEDGHWEIANPRGVVGSADIYDLAKGFLAHLHDTRKLREWAFVIEAADLDLDVDSHPAGETMLNALWRASFGEPLGEDVIKVIEQLASTNPSHT